MRHQDASTRRAALDRIAASASFTAVAPAAAAGPAEPHPDAELLALGAEMDAAHVRERAAWAALDRAGWTEAEDAACEALADAVSAVINRILPVPARTLDGLLVKARAVDWCWSGEGFEPDSPRDTTDVKLCYSAMRDLLALAKAGETPAGAD